MSDALCIFKSFVAKYNYRLNNIIYSILIKAAAVIVISTYDKIDWDG